MSFRVQGSCPTKLYFWIVVFLAGQLKYLVFSAMQNKYWYEELYHTVAEGVEVLHRDIFSIEDNCYQDVYGMDCIFP